MSHSNSPDDSISGLWSGVYDYPDNVDEAVPFRAHITDYQGTISGEIEEPNTIAKSGGSTLSARFTGTRNGNTVAFLKYYEDHPETEHAIRYEGTLNADKTKIEGQWTTIDEEFPWSGPFVMNRSIKEKNSGHLKEEATLTT